MLHYRNEVLAVMNQKGGVGKSTTAELFAEFMAINLGKKVLLVDTDMQCNTSERYVEMTPVVDDPTNEAGFVPTLLPDYDPEVDTHIRPDSNIADIFDGLICEPRETAFNPDNEEDPIPGIIDVMVGHPTKLEQVNGRYADNSVELVENIVNRLQEVLHDPQYGDFYDLIIIDTAPTRTPLFRAAMRAATHIVIPFEPEQKSLQGLLAMYGAVRNERSYRNGDRDVQLVGLVPNKVRSVVSSHREVLAYMYADPHHSGLMPPEGIVLPLTAEISSRDFKKVKPDSLFKLPRSNKQRQKGEDMMLHIARKVFAGHALAPEIEAYAKKWGRK
jgi:chromosome partitioning protein